MRKMSLLIALSLILFAGCATTTYEEEKQFLEEGIEFKFSLNSTFPTYKVVTDVNYDCKLGHERNHEKIKFTLRSPSQKIYNNQMSLRKSDECAMIQILSDSIKNVAYEEGEFVLSVTKDQNKYYPINDVTIKVKGIK